MPQMSPILWMNLFIMFLLSLILILTVQYFLGVYLKLELDKELCYMEEKVWKW
uniref:ATP synthase complex subunit 8 n=1 Tax=Astacus astacus TaxID=6715 RepID=A0A1W2KDX5_ASTAS|nr:ATP synthase F0 subunit 8 [Astacus astacus]ANN13226.1 ATP synthase F0 subunit 8 [Astacus astacus]QNV12203.1 ATP synthase F0 subunit 8 [Astacus astacus]